MAKKLIKNTQELMDRAQELHIETEGQSIQDIAQAVINRLMQWYDTYYMYIDNYKQMKQAEERNNEIDDEVNSIKKLINTLPVQEESIMETTNNTATINPVETKEETTMKNMSKAERIQDVARRIEQFTKTSDEGYVTKEEMAELIFDCMGGAKPNTKKYKRDQLIETVMIMAGKYNPDKSVPVGDLEITRDNAPEETVAPANDARAKTDKLFALLKKYATANEKNGYGYTISSFMLQAAILEAGTGLLKFKGHKITDEEAKLTKNIYAWLKNHGYIKPVIYSVKEDENVRVYMPEYTGRTTSDKTKLIDFAHSAKYTAKQCTSFLVTVR